MQFIDIGLVQLFLIFTELWNGRWCAFSASLIISAFTMHIAYKYTHIENIAVFLIEYPFIFADCNGIYGDIVLSLFQQVGIR